MEIRTTGPYIPFDMRDNHQDWEFKYARTKKELTKDYNYLYTGFFSEFVPSFLHFFSLLYDGAPNDQLRWRLANNSIAKDGDSWSKPLTYIAYGGNIDLLKSIDGLLGDSEYNNRFHNNYGYNLLHCIIDGVVTVDTSNSFLRHIDILKHPNHFACLKFVLEKNPSLKNETDNHQCTPLKFAQNLKENLSDEITDLKIKIKSPIFSQLYEESSSDSSEDDWVEKQQRKLAGLMKKNACLEKIIEFLNK